VSDGFGIDHLPYGVFRWEGERARIGARIGDGVVDLSALELGGVPQEVWVANSLNPFLALGRERWSAVRRDLQAACERGVHTMPIGEVELLCPLDPPDYVDFYSSIEHATNLGRMFRPDGEALLPNWRHLPVGYHGRSASVVASGTPVRRPLGQRPPAPSDESGAPSFGPSLRLDFELELGFVTGNGPPLGTPIAADAAREHIFGVTLVNDWSARDLQRWEYQPLGPFNAKSFATTVGAWVTPLEALAPVAVAPPAQDPEPFAYLRTDDPLAFDIALEVALVPAGATAETVISRTSSRALYWTMAQQLAHATIGGARVRAGDLFASGTISGTEPGSFGSLIELTWGGRDPIAVEGGERTFLQDGDEVVLRGRAGTVTLAEARGRIEPSPDVP